MGGVVTGTPRFSDDILSFSSAAAAVADIVDVDVDAALVLFLLEEDFLVDIDCRC